MAENTVADIVEQIRVIRGRTEDRGFTQAEAEQAAAMVQRLLLTHNLSMADLDQEAEKAGRSVVHDDYEVVAHRYRIDLLFTVAEGHLCKAVKYSTTRWDRKNYVRMRVVGHDHNLIMVRDIYPWLVSTCDRLSARLAREAKKNLDMEYLLAGDSTWQRSFKAGFVSGIDQSYREARRQVEAETPADQWALVPVLEDEVDEVFNQMFPKLGDLRRPTSVLGGAYKAGIEQGRAHGINRQVS